jgi:hypothetical protein
MNVEDELYELKKELNELQNDIKKNKDSLQSYAQTLVAVILWQNMIIKNLLKH